MSDLAAEGPVLPDPTQVAGQDGPPVSSPPWSTGGPSADVCACAHRRDLHYRTLFKNAPDTRCAVVACDCVEFVPYVPDGRSRD